jgi:hypothetical protein
VNAKSESDFEAAFATVAQELAGALLVSDDPVFINSRKKLIELAALHAVPAIYGRREFSADGDWQATVQAQPINIISAGAMSVVFWLGPSRQICRSCSRASSNW